MSPLVFSLTMFFILLLNLIINIFWGYIDARWTFYVAAILLILGVTGGVLDKYLKNSIKANKIKTEIGLDGKSNEKSNDLLIAELAGTEINNKT